MRANIFFFLSTIYLVSLVPLVPLVPTQFTICATLGCFPLMLGLITSTQPTKFMHSFSKLSKVISTEEALSLVMRQLTRRFGEINPHLQEQIQS
jgi:hypothetical protein